MRRFTWIRLLASLDFLRRYARRPLEADARPPYIQNNFEQPAIEAAIERLRAFPG
jgi:hypothetical protein